MLTVNIREAMTHLSKSGNWRLTFEFIMGEVESLDLEDYH